jgi:hypothetical protein
MSGGFIQRTYFEICRYRDGKLIGEPLPCATLKEAQRGSGVDGTRRFA